jgi:EmrB/QacA subfamily drug resistance transporter
MTAIAVPNVRVRTSRQLVLALVVVAQFMVVLDATIVTVALPSIESSLHFHSQLSLQWVINAYILVFGGFLLLGGRAGDLYGRRTLFVAGLALFTGASLVNGLAQSSEMLIAGRAAQGLGGALVSPAVLSIIIATFTGAGERAKALGIFSAVTTGGAAVGFVLGGVLTDALSWRWIFLVNIPIGVLGVLLALRYLPNSRDQVRRRSLDVPGAITVTGGVSLLVYAVVNAQAWGWGSTRFILTAVGAVLLLLAFVAVELRSRAPLVRLGIFMSRSLSAANATMFLFISAQYTMLFFPTLYMQQVLGYSPIKTGLAYLAWPLAMMATAPLAVRAMPRFGARPLLAVGLALGAAGLFMISRLPDHGSYAAHILPAFVVNAAGAGLTYATLFMVATAGVRSQEAGLASGIINTSQQLGAAIGLSALAAVAASRTAHLLQGAGSPAERTHALVVGFQRGFLIAGMLVIAAAVVAILTVRRHDLEQLPEEAPAKSRSDAETASPLPRPSANGQSKILIAFDGSENARHAIQVAARELGGGRAAVLHVWEPFVGDSSTLCISCPPAVAIQPPTAATGEAVELEAERALATAEEGAAFAREAGFDAEPHSLRTDGSIGEAILGYADEHPTRLIVIGTRGLSGLREALTGSVTHHVSEHVHVPLLAVPPEHESERSAP